jgi:very-short-patch-repair endonuclease
MVTSSIGPAFERDRRRDAALQLAGYRVYRVTYRELEKDAAGVSTVVRSLLATPPA